MGEDTKELKAYQGLIREPDYLLHIVNDVREWSHIPRKFLNRNECDLYLAQIRWGEIIKCAWCGSDKIYFLKDYLQHWKCQKCRKRFSAYKGTIFANTKISFYRWLWLFKIISEHWRGVSSRRAAKFIGVTQGSCYKMMDKIRRNVTSEAGLRFFGRKV